MLEFTAGFFGIRFEEVADAMAWREDVKQLEVFDADTNEKLGRIYLDLFYHEDKTVLVPNTAMVATSKTADSIRYIPQAVVATSIYDSGSTPLLLGYTDVQTLFHEFGHALAAILSKNDFSTLTEVPLLFRQPIHR